MSKVQLPQDFSKVDQWEKFLNESAYRGYNINRLSESLLKGNIKDVKYFADARFIRASFKNGPIMKTIIPVDRINKRWSFSRWNHERKMKNVDSHYARLFNVRIFGLANELARDHVKAKPQASIPTPGGFGAKLQPVQDGFGAKLQPQPFQAVIDGNFLSSFHANEKFRESRELQNSGAFLFISRPKIKNVRILNAD